MRHTRLPVITQLGNFFSLITFEQIKMISALRLSLMLPLVVIRKLI